MLLKKVTSVFSLALFIVFIFTSCMRNEQEELRTQITQMEKQLYENKNGIINTKEAANMIHLYTAFIEKYPKDSKSPSYLFKAADVSINTFHSQQTINLFNQLILQYPDFDKAPQSLFLKAFTFENYLNQLDSAEVSYQLFLEKYPNHSFANDAQVSLNNLGLSPEEIIKAFNENKK